MEVFESAITISHWLLNWRGLNQGSLQIGKVLLKYFEFLDWLGVANLFGNNGLQSIKIYLLQFSQEIQIFLVNLALLEDMNILEGNDLFGRGLESNSLPFGIVFKNNILHWNYYTYKLKYNTSFTIVFVQVILVFDAHVENPQFFLVGQVFLYRLEPLQDSSLRFSYLVTFFV
jgi:hypothetical protein